jgi:hypothetical protein
LLSSDLAPPPSLPPPPALPSVYARPLTHRKTEKERHCNCWQENVGEGRGEAISYDCEKAWSSINNSILCGEVPTEGVHDLVFWIMFWQFCQKKGTERCIPCTNWANVFCLLSSFPLSPHAATTAVSSLYSLTLYCRCGLAYLYDWRGLVGPKMKTSMGLSIFLIPRCLVRCPQKGAYIVHLFKRTCIRHMQTDWLSTDRLWLYWTVLGND